MIRASEENPVIVTCPACGNQVVPRSSDNTCPACGASGLAEASARVSTSAATSSTASATATVGTDARDSVNPYAPPREDSRPARGRFGIPYASATGIVTGLTLAFTAIVVCVLLTMWTELAFISCLRGLAAGNQAASADTQTIADRMAALGVASAGAQLAAGILFCMWMNRSHHNARALGAKTMRFGPNAWGWFFCPIVQLWYPYQVVSELWTAVNSRKSMPMTMPTWWAGWMLAHFTSVCGSFLAGISAASLSRPPPSFADLITPMWIQIGGGGLSVLAALLAIAVVRGLHGLYEELHSADAKTA